MAAVDAEAATTVVAALGTAVAVPIDCILLTGVSERILLGADRGTSCCPNELVSADAGAAYCEAGGTKEIARAELSSDGVEVPGGGVTDVAGGAL